MSGSDPTKKNVAEMLSSSWEVQYEECIRVSIDARSELRLWEEYSGEQQTAQAVKVRRLLGKLGELTDELESALLEEQLEVKNLQEKDIARRQGLVTKLKDERMEMSRLLSSGKPKVSFFEPKRDYSKLSTSDLGTMQKTEVRVQDELLGDLEHSIVRQREIGIAIGDEATESTALLKKVQKKTDASNSRVGAETEKIEKFEVTAVSWALYIIIVLLVIILIILLATDGGCYIIRSKASCSMGFALTPNLWLCGAACVGLSMVLL